MKQWTKPVATEISVGLEINSYACAVNYLHYFFGISHML